MPFRRKKDAEELSCGFEGNSIIVNIDISEVMALKNKNWTKLYSFLIYVLVKMINNHEEFRTVINDKGKVGGYFITVLYSFS